ncbi:hypothetical protein N9609_00465, partial [bacterium]|nr:hypothetical protein [bacterium]
SVLKKSQDLREKIVAQCEKRDQYFTARSDKWQESANGKAYNKKTADLADSVEAIDQAITEIKSFLE